MKIVVIGGSRGVGLAVSEQAAAKGHQVSTLVRDATTFRPPVSSVHVVQGDATSGADIERAVDGQDAVVCTLGADTRGPTNLYSVAAGNIVDAMRKRRVERIIFLSNFGVLGERSLHPVTGLLTLIAGLAIKATLEDHRRALKTLEASNLRWTAVRPMRLTDGPLTQVYRVSDCGLPAGGTSISRADVAHFMLNQLESSQYVGKVPAVAY